MAEEVEVQDNIETDNDPNFEHLPDGRWCATVDLQDGSPVQKFYGNTQREVTSKLIDAQKNATRKIKEQKKLLKVQGPVVDPAQPVADFVPRQLTPDEKFKLSQQLSDPSKSAEAVRKLVEAELGADLGTVRQTLQRVNDADDRRAAEAAAEQFKQQHPRYKETPDNEALLIAYLKNRGMAFTSRNLHIAYEDLSDELDLIPEAIPSANVNVRPRLMNATGIPARTGAVRSPKPAKLTVADITAMDLATYKAKMRDPHFREQVEEAYRNR